ncbi:MAG: Trk family potassium uptake protein [Clostridia bacterium]|nr:Trk family potassium uptake protein [Clostridia bacterium]
MKTMRRNKLSVWKFLSLGYVTVILVGSFLLSLPFSSANGTWTDYIDALFTATSATCVTGLIPVDTATHWSVFGQIVILILIQTGGLGFMTFVSMLLNLVKKSMGLSEKKALMVSAGENERVDLRRLLKRILVGALLFELLGAMVLSIRFIQDFGVGKGIFMAVWHAVSAFCNAGFDLMGGAFNGEKFVSLTYYSGDPLVLITIALLIIMGGLGFCVWDDVLECNFNAKKFSLHTKIVLCWTFAMLVVSTGLFLLFERNNTAFGNTFGEKLLSSFFAATTPRTAGFNSVEIQSYTDSSYLLTLVLMFIGGSTGSTAGGIKITTFAVIVMGMISVFRGKRDIEVGKRRVHSALLHQALAVFVAFLFIVITAAVSICAIEENNSLATLQTILFEVISALGTVGLSMSLTPTLTVASKLILIALMYLGRVGILTFVFALSQNKQTVEVKKPIDNIMIG